MAHNNSKSGIRSLVCDSNGIIIAEMVYRCMICSAIHDLLDEAQRHYQIEHIDDNDDLKGGTNAHNALNASQQLVDSDLEDEDELNAMTYELPVSLADGSNNYEELYNQSTSNSVTVSVPASLRQLQYHTNASNADNSLIMSSQQMREQSMDHYTNRPKPISFAQPSNSFLLPFGGSPGMKAASKRIGGGFVTCEVCGLTKYYSHISRRYGVFSCESCAKFFYRYLLKPSKFTCPNNGSCSLKIDVPGGRCKSCLLQACLQKYIIDPKKHPKIFSKSPGITDKNLAITGANAANPVPANVQIKISKQPNKLLVGNQAIKQSVKQEIGIDDMKTLDSFDTPVMATNTKPSTNGIVIKATPPSGSSAKRKQQFGDETVSVTRSRRIGCRECPGCLADDCGQCLYCLDKPKFGGNDVKKQRCIKRRCHKANYT